MKTIGNIVWFICGGFLAALMWLMSGLICCVTVVGIPLGKDIRFGGGAPSFIANILWIILLGWENAVYCAAMGVVCCCTIIGIPLGLQYFKFAKLAFMPFGSEVVDC